MPRETGRGQSGSRCWRESRDTRGALIVGRLRGKEGKHLLPAQLLRHPGQGLLLAQHVLLAGLQQAGDLLKLASSLHTSLTSRNLTSFSFSWPSFLPSSSCAVLRLSLSEVTWVSQSFIPPSSHHLLNPLSDVCIPPLQLRPRLHTRHITLLLLPSP